MIRGDLIVQPATERCRHDKSRLINRLSLVGHVCLLGLHDAGSPFREQAQPARLPDPAVYTTHLTRSGLGRAVKVSNRSSEVPGSSK